MRRGKSKWFGLWADLNTHTHSRTDINIKYKMKIQLPDCIICSSTVERLVCCWLCWAVCTLLYNARNWMHTKWALVVFSAGVSARELCPCAAICMFAAKDGIEVEIVIITICVRLTLSSVVHCAVCLTFGWCVNYWWTRIRIARLIFQPTFTVQL